MVMENSDCLAVMDKTDECLFVFEQKYYEREIDISTMALRVVK